MRRTLTSPVRFKTSPSTMLQLTRQEHGVNYHVIEPISRRLPPTNIAPHRNIQQHGHVSHRPRPLGDCSLHDGPPINVPNQPALTCHTPRLLPRKVIAHRTSMHIMYFGPHDTVLMRLMMLTPMETTMVFAITVPCFCNVNLSISWPAKWLLGEQPERRPYSFHAGGQDDCRENALVTSQCSSANKTSGGVSLFWI